MTLPVGQLARSSFDFNGTAIPIRSLSRAETLAMRPLGDDLEAVEIHMLACGTDSSREEVQAFRESQPPGQIDDLIAAIADLSGIKVSVQESEPDPKGE